MLLKAKLLLLTVIIQLGAAQHSDVKAPTNSTAKPPLITEAPETNNLQEQIDALNAQLAALNATVEANKNDVEELQEDVETISESISIKNALSLCHDYYEAGVRESGYYQIDPDGEEGNIEPFEVFCDFDSDAGVTMISHDSEERTLVSGCEDPGCYSRNISYALDMEQITAIIALSKSCRQYAKYECFDSMLFHYENEAWWLSRDGVEQHFWAGAEPDSQMCQCGADENCDNNVTTCNCDNNDAAWREDDGYFDQIELLPVMQLNFGDTEALDERGFHTLGKLECSGKTNHQSCATLKEQGYPSGNYSINPSPNIESFEVYCDMESYPGTGITVIDHDSSSSGYLYGYTYCSGYDNTIDYGVSMDDIASLINISNHCTQYISWRCYNNYFLYYGYSWWLSRDGEKMTYWGGATPDHDGYCSCGESGTCAGGTSTSYKCNCDKSDTTWRIDAGNLIDKSKLPVSGLHFGFASCSTSSSYYSRGEYKLGPLKCF